LARWHKEPTIASALRYGMLRNEVFDRTTPAGRRVRMGRNVRYAVIFSLSASAGLPLGSTVGL
jgi:hypothetical protein